MNFLNKKYSVSLHFGNTEKTIYEMDEIDILYGLSEKDKDFLLLNLINIIKKNSTKTKIRRTCLS